MELRDGTTVLRAWTDDDVEAIPPLANDRDVWLGVRDAFPHPYGLDDARLFVARMQGATRLTVFAIAVEGRLAGGIGYVPKEDVERVGAEVGYWLGRAFWGRGIATTALRLLTRHAFDANPELRRLWAVPFATNVASARVLEKAGYRREGVMRQSAIKDGRVLDQWLYAILRDDLPPA